jgi:hypothetical protein
MKEEEQCCFLWIKEREMRETTPSEALFIQPMHLLAREEDRMMFSVCRLCISQERRNKTRISDTTATINYSKSVCLSSNCRKKERKPQRLQRKQEPQPNVFLLKPGIPKVFSNNLLLLIPSPIIHHTAFRRVGK